MAVAELDGAAIVNEASFFAESARAFGFHTASGDTIDTWVDCLSYLRDEENMTRFRLRADETLDIVITDSAALRARLPDLIDEIVFCVGGINERYEDYGEAPALALILR
jgi:hypothetical protein